jgi:hypothetical protein
MKQGRVSFNTTRGRGISARSNWCIEARGESCSGAQPGLACQVAASTLKTSTLAARHDPGAAGSKSPLDLPSKEPRSVVSIGREGTNGSTNEAGMGPRQTSPAPQLTTELLA